MAKINCKTVIKDLAGNPIPDGTGKEGEYVNVGPQIASMLIKPRQAPLKGLGAMKSYELATKFHTQKEVELDEADLEAVQNMVEKEEGYSPLVLAQILKALKQPK